MSGKPIYLHRQGCYGKAHGKYSSYLWHHSKAHPYSSMSGRRTRMHHSSPLFYDYPQRLIYSRWQKRSLLDYYDRDLCLCYWRKSYLALVLVLVLALVLALVRWFSSHFYYPHWYYSPHQGYELPHGVCGGRYYRPGACGGSYCLPGVKWACQCQCQCQCQYSGILGFVIQGC